MLSLRSGSHGRMTAALRVKCATFMLLVSSAAMAQDGLSRSEYRLFRVKIGDHQDLIENLVQKGFDIAGRNRPRGTVDVITHSPEQERELAALSPQIHATWGVDHGFAPDSNYKTPAEIETILQEYASKYPSLVALYSIGKSVEGRDIWAAKITQNPQEEDPSKPAILFNALHHAREVMTPEVALDTLDQLVTRFDQDPEITHWVQSNVIWIVPMVNPDGSNRVWTRNNMWRKNTRGGHGVDINRNYPYAWNACNGSSGSTGSDTFRGPTPGSEPETQTLMALVEKVQPVFDISYHSYSEMVLYPYGCNGRRAEASEVIEPIGRAIAKALPSDSGRGTYVAGTSWEILYSVDGSDIDWMYHEQNVLPFVIELNADSLGFQPPYSWRQPTVEKLRSAWQLLLRKLDQSGIRGLVKSQGGELHGEVPIIVEQWQGQQFAALVQSKSKKNGSFHVVLRPGRYRVTFGSGSEQVIKDVMVGDDRSDFDVVL